ncbi:MAG: hypothetical protein JST68_24155 [Bacteroidetes bacterium]|nr:hypothetical protein [Bacteroidota bacterium]
MSNFSNLVASTSGAIVINGDRQMVSVEVLNDFRVEPEGVGTGGVGAGRVGGGFSLHFEDLKSKDTIPIIDVYLGPNYIGSMGLYGLNEDSGMNQVFELGPIVINKKLDLVLVPSRPFPPGAVLQIGRIALYYHE